MDKDDFNYKVYESNAINNVYATFEDYPPETIDYFLKKKF